MNDRLHKFQQNINIFFTDINLLQQAFRHRSYVNENADACVPDNERLEFLGDAVLNYITAEKIFDEFPDLSEGELTVLRTSLIREETLAHVASELDLGNYLQLGKGEESSGGRKRQSNLANTFEALLGAILLDQGINSVKDLLNKILYAHTLQPYAKIHGQNYKATLQEFTQFEHKKLPHYHLLESSGPDHEKKFIVQVILDDKVLGMGTGRSKKTAEMEAAKKACETLALI